MQKAPGDIRVVTLTGSPQERGRTHGETLRADIGDMMTRWKEALQIYSEMPAGAFIDLFLDKTNFAPAIDRHTPGLLDEVRGLAEGAGISFRDAYAYQLVDEQWIFSRRLREQRTLAHAEHCTVLGSVDLPDAPPILAQNMDLPKFYDGSQVLLHLKDGDTGLEALILSVAGLIVTCGVNSNGVGCCCNTVSQLSSSRDGLPVTFMMRAILAQPTRSDAETFVRTTHQASGQNYTIGDPHGLVSLECSANQAVEFRPSPTRVFHTNHPVVNDDLELKPNGAGSIPDPITGRQRTNTEIRFDAVADAFRNHPEPITVDTAAAILSDPETLVCALRDNPIPSFTFGSVIMELSAPPVLHLAPGPGAVTEYRAWRFN